MAREFYERHGKYGTPEYVAWCAMKTRCYNPNIAGYKNYGGRGIEVSDTWIHNFPKFLEDVGIRPSNNHSLDRIDNEGNYEPGNVRWATRQEQNLNRREYKVNYNSISGIKGVTRKRNKWMARLVIDGKHVILGYFDKMEEAQAKIVEFKASL